MSDIPILSISRQDTMILKGVAILAMLFHHLYDSLPVGVESYHGPLHILGILGNVCVAMFVFCSGYGLAASYGRLDTMQLKFTDRVRTATRFVASRMIGFYANYWVIFLVFVPIGVFVMGRPLLEFYRNDRSLAISLLLDLLGISDCPYNPTWWFNQLIIKLYVLFPLLWWLCKKGKVMMMMASLLLLSIPGLPSWGACVYQMPFVAGILWRQNEGQMQFLWLKSKWLMLCAMGTTIVLLYARLSGFPAWWKGVRLDGFITAAVAICLILTHQRVQWLPWKMLAYLGMHSGNIYLMHTFFTAWWFAPFFQTGDLMRGGLNYVASLTICLPCSILIEYMKRITGMVKITSRVRQRLLVADK